MHYGIIAAGEGSRLAQEGVEKPKPLVQICGTPMIERLIRIFIACKAESISVIVNEHMKEVISFLKGLQATLPVELRVVVKSTPSSMHSFYELSQVMPRDGKFILTTVDTIFRPADFARYVEQFDAAGPEVDAMMAVTSYIDDEKPLYVQLAAGTTRIKAFLDTRAGDVKFVSGGIYGLRPSSFKVLEECIGASVSRMRNYQRGLLQAGLHVQAFDMGKILDIDHASDIAKAEAYLKANNN